MLVLYIDPGTGSMLFTIVIGAVSVCVFFLRSLLLKLKFFFTSGGGEKRENSGNKFVIFSDDKRYWNTFESICNEFEKRKIGILYLTASEDDPAFSKNYKYVKCEFSGQGNRTFARLNLLKADVLLSTTPNLGVYQWKKSPDVKYYVHIFHGIGWLYNMFSLDMYDAVLTPGPIFESPIREIESQRSFPSKEIKVVGLPCLDALYKKKESAATETNNVTTVLLAPSWGSNAILSRYGCEFIDALIKTGYDIIVRPHPQSFKSEKEIIEPLMKKYPDSEHFKWNTDVDNFDVLNKSDILISDFSGVVYDYNLIFGKPYIYSEFEFDISKYDAYWLKDEPWELEAIKRLGTPLNEGNFDKIKDLIDACLSDANASVVREEVIREGWNHIGKSAELTVDYLVEKQKSFCTENSASESDKEFESDDLHMFY